MGGAKVPLLFYGASVDYRKIALIGTAPSGKDGPYNDISYEIWGVASRLSYVTRADRWFELHRLAGEPPAFQEGWRKDIKKFSGDIELVMLYPEPDLGPRVTAYPYQRIVDRFGTYFMTSSFAWMMALAIDEMRPSGGKPVDGEIGIWGVDMEYGTEYCTAAETRVLTADLRWVPAGDVQVGDRFLAFDEHATRKTHRRWREATVEKAERLTRPCYRLYMTDGTELRCSAEHRWLVNSCNQIKWRRTDKMRPMGGKNIHTTRICKFIEPWDATLRGRDAGYVAGALDGDGSLVQTQSGSHIQTLISFAQRDNAMSEEFSAASKRLGYDFRRFSSGNGKNSDCYTWTLRGGRKTLIEFLGQLRPPRLMKRFDASKLGVIHHRGHSVAIERMEFLGEQSVIGLNTSTGTFIAEGFASHNSQQRVGFRHFVDVARVLGINVTRFADTGLSFEPVPYPLWQDDPMLNKLMQRASENSKKLDASEETLKRTHTMIAQNKMAIQELSAPLLKKKRLARIAFLEKELNSLMATSGQISQDIVHCSAVEAELKYWRDYISP